MGSAPTVQPTDALVKGTIRQFAIRSCTLASDDLRRLKEILQQCAEEAIDLQIRGLKRQPGQTSEQFEALKTQVRQLLRPVVTVNSGTGDWVSGTGEEVLSDRELPDSITSVVYDSAFLFRGQTKTEPQNSFNVHLDFSRTPILDLSNLVLGPEQNKSACRLAGIDDTWVKASDDDLRNFFGQRKNARGLMHSRYSYDAALWLLGFPAAVDSVYHIDRALKISELPTSVGVLLYILIFFFLLILFRVMFNHAKWVFPKIEGPERRSWPKLHKGLVIVIGTTLISLVVTGILRVIGFPV